MRRPAEGTRVYLLALVSLTAIQIVSTIAFNQASVLAPEAAPALGAAPADIAYYVSLVYLAALASTVGAGALSRRLGPIRFTQIGLAIAGVGSLMFAAGDLALAAVSALVVGLGSGPLTIASSQILARVSPPRLANVTFSLKQSGVPVGFALCGALLPTFALDWGWRGAAAGVGMLSFVGALAIEPLRATLDTHADGPRPARLLPSWSEVIEPVRLALRDPVLRAMCAIGMVFSATQAIVVNFTVVYAVDGLGMDFVAAGALLSAATIAGAFGRVFWGVVADALRRPALVLAGLGAIIAVTSFAMAFSGPHWPGWLVLAVWIVIGGTAVGWNGVFIAESAYRAPPGRAGEFTAVTSMFVFAGPLLSPLLFRGLLHATGSYALGYALLAIAVGACSVFMARAARR